MRLVLIVAQSLDGFITRHDDPGTAWASAADQKWFRSCLRDFDAQVMGRTTYETVRSDLLARREDGRHRVIMTRSPERHTQDVRLGALEFTAASANEIVESLRAAGRSTCAILGGGHVHDALLAAGLVDEIWVTVEPRVFGRGTPLVYQDHDLQMELIRMDRLDESDSVVLRYRLNR